MTTPQPNPLELAKQGNVQAIAFLINRSLQTKGITAKTLFRDGYLQVMLESTQIPDQETLASFIYKGVITLGITPIKKLRVYGKKIGEDRPGWSKEFDLLEQTETLFSTVGSQSFEPSNTSQLSLSENEKAQTTSQVNSTAQSTSSQSKIQDKKVEAKDQLSAVSEPAMIRQGCFGCLGISFFVIIGLYIFGLFVGTNQPTSPASKSPVLPSPIAIERKPEELLAVIDNQPGRVTEYAILLDQLMPKCQEDRMLLADMSVKTQELLTQKGARANNFQILNAAYQNVKPYNEPQKCAAAFALIATIVNQ